MAMVYLSLLQMERSGSLTRWGGGEVYIINWLSLVPGHLRCGQLDRKQFGLCWSNCVHGYDSFGYTTVWPHNCIHVLIFWVKTVLYCGRCQLCVCKPVRVILVQAGQGSSCSGRSGFFLFRPVGVILVQAGQGYSFLLTQNYTQYIPLSLYDLQAWMGSPSIYIFDCSNAGTVFSGFSVDSCVNREEGYPLPRAHKNGQLE